MESECKGYNWAAGFDSDARRQVTEEVTGIPILLRFTLLYFTDVAFFTNQRQAPPPAKRVRLALLRNLFYRGDLEPTP